MNRIFPVQIFSAMTLVACSLIMFGAVERMEHAMEAGKSLVEFFSGFRDRLKETARR